MNIKSKEEICLIKVKKSPFIFYEKGLTLISNAGNRVKTDSIASSIAIPVNTPK